MLLTTHYLEEAEALADRLEIMHGGRIVRSGTPVEIAAGHPSTISFTTLPGLPTLAGVPTSPAGDRGARHHDHRDRRPAGVLTDLLDRAARHGVRLERLEARTASLESVFLGIADHAADPIRSRQPRRSDPMSALTTSTAASLCPGSRPGAANAVLLMRNRLALFYGWCCRSHRWACCSPASAATPGRAPPR